MTQFSFSQEPAAPKAKKEKKSDNKGEPQIPPEGSGVDPKWELLLFFLIFKILRSSWSTTCVDFFVQNLNRKTFKTTCISGDVEGAAYGAKM